MTNDTATEYFVVDAPGTYGDRSRVWSSHRTAEAARRRAGAGGRDDHMAQLRELSVRFFRLTLSQKSAIAGKLSLMEESDANQPDFERFRRVLLRARDRQLMEALEQEIGSADRLTPPRR